MQGVQRTAGAAHGFTLIELIVVMTLVGILAAVVGRFVAGPVEGYTDLARRARLVDRAETALERMTREIHLALPNSVRVSGSKDALEFLRVLTGGRYRAQAPGDPLDFTATNDTFDVLGGLPDAALVDAGAGAAPADCAAGNVDCLVIYNTGQSGADAYAQDNIAAVQDAGAASVTFDAAQPFPLTSPGQRFYVVDTPVSFVCDDTGLRRIRRYQGYPIEASHADVDTDAELAGAGAEASLLTDRVVGCRFDYEPGTATRGALVTLRITLEEDGERVNLLQQIHMSNVP